jgi:hypothetical protein
MGETVVLGGLVDDVLAIGPKVRRFRSGRGGGIFKAIKFRSKPSFGGELGPMSQDFTAC